MSVACVDRTDSPSNDSGAKSADNSFNFGEFRHDSNITGFRTKGQPGGYCFTTDTSPAEITIRLPP